MSNGPTVGSQSFKDYLSRIAARLHNVVHLRAIATILMALFLITLVVAIGGSKFGFTESLFFVGRCLLVVSLLGLGYQYWLRPLRRLDSKGVSKLLERAVPDLNGRAETYTELLAKKTHTPFLQLLDQDANRSISTMPANKVVSSRRIVLPVLLIVLFTSAFAWLFSGAPQLWRVGAGQLWLSWLPGDQAVTSTFKVLPGDAQVRNGDDLLILVEATGFSPDTANLHVRMDKQQWQLLEMPKTDEGHFEYTFYGLNSSLDYYVSSVLTDSEEFSIDVLQPRHIENIVVTYTYPAWTGLDPLIENPGGDLLAVSGTVVDIAIETDRPLLNGELVFNGTAISLTRERDRYQASVQIDEASEWYVTDILGGTKYKLTEDFDVSLLDDQPPNIQFVQPGRDWSASPIEEVSLTMEAEDDFAIENISLHYAVNAGDWKSIDLDKKTQATQTLYLEEMTTSIVAANTQNTGLLPGDLISYYAEARDHQQSRQTDIMFINVRPFDRNFTQSQQGANQNGQGGGSEQQEISRRQREILIATWNLDRQAKNDSLSQHESLQDNANLLADMQKTLAEQTTTLVRRSNARQLAVQDEKIGQFVNYLKEAAQAMTPASEKLTELQLSEAVKPQQKALQYLQRAEAVFKDIQVSQQQAMGQGNSSISQDMAEMFELEMDLAKNQYEVPDTPASQAKPETFDDSFEKLSELAKRQQQMAEKMENQQAQSSIERWQLEKLRRDLQDLKEQLENQRQTQQPNTDQQQAMQTTGQAVEKIEQALRSMQQGGQAMQETESLLKEALSSLANQQHEALQEQIDNASSKSNELLHQQRQSEERIRKARDLALNSDESSVFSSGLTPSEEDELAKRKRQMQRELEEVVTDIRKTAKQFATQSPNTAAEIRTALKELKDSEVSVNLGLSGDAIDMGMAHRNLLTEESITEALRYFRDRMSNASALAGIEGRDSGNPDERIQIAGLQDAVRDLRRALDSASQGSEQRSNRPGNPQQNGQANQTPGSPSVGYSGKELGSGQQPGSSPIPDKILENSEANEVNLALQRLRSTMQHIEDSEVNDQDLQTLRQIAATKSPESREVVSERVGREYMKLRHQVEQIELSLAERSREQKQIPIQTTARNSDPEGFEHEVADYFRMLSDSRTE